jgi:hypothetical protein
VGTLRLGSSGGLGVGVCGVGGPDGQDLIGFDGNADGVA